MTRRLLSMMACSAVAIAALASNIQAAEKLAGSTSVPQGVMKAAGSNSGGAGIYITSSTIGFNTSGAPCFNCGPAGSIAIPYPQVALPGGTEYAVTIQEQSLFYSGFPTVNITLTQNGQVIGTGSTSFTSEFLPGYVGYAYFVGTLPNTPGVVTVTSSLTSRDGTQLAPGGLKFSIY